MGTEYADGAVPDFPGRYASRLVCRLVTVGRLTGTPHDIEMWFGVSGSAIYFISGNGPGADWYRNLLAEPQVEIRFDADTRLGIAHDVVEPPERRLVGKVMGDKYGGWGGDPSIGLTEHDWLWTVPAVGVDRWHVPERSAPSP